ncbi:hypothetical protein [Cupriavidus basilensis]
MSQTIELFPQGAHDPVEQKIDRAIVAILRLFQAAHPVVVAYSGGKDSSVVAALVLHAALLNRAGGGEPLVIVTTSDTKVESPEVNLHYRAELKRMRAFGEQHGFTVIAKVVEPQLASTFQVKVLTGRALPSFPGLHGDCSFDLKIGPQRAFRKQLFRSLAERGAAAPVTCLGTRFDEGARRASNMRQRGESADRPASNKDGELVLSPIAHFNSDDVWETIALYGGGAGRAIQTSRRPGGCTRIRSALRAPSSPTLSLRGPQGASRESVAPAWAAMSARWLRTRASPT